MNASAAAIGWRRVGKGLSRLGALLLAVTAALLFAFVLPRLTPGDPAEIRIFADGGAASPDAIAALRVAHGLDRPFAAQFLAWISALALGDAGRSFANDRPVLAEFTARLPWSLAIGSGGLGLAVLLGGLLGFRAGIHPGGLSDAVSRLLAVAGQAVPTFATALLLYWLLAVEWRLIRPASGPPLERLIGPVLVVALFSAGAFARVTTDALRRVESSPWFVTARAKGLSREEALRRHGAGQVALAVLAALVPELGRAIGGTATVELVFGIPGLSALLVGAAGARDHAVLQAFLLFVLAWMGLVAMLAGLLERWIDPRPS